MRFHLLLLLFVSFVAHAQSPSPGLDPNYNPKFYATGTVTDMVLQGDGKVLVSGSFTRYNNVAANGIVRLNTDGSVDNTFSVGTGPANGLIIQLEVQSNGKILASGHFDSFNGTAAKRLVRLNTDGSVDDSFNATAALDNQTTGSSVLPLALQPDGKILQIVRVIASGESYSDLIRLNTDGSKDGSFTTARFTGIAYDVKYLPSNKIIVGGSMSACNGTTIKNVAALSAIGALDNTFGTGANSTVHHLGLQSTGKVILVGDFSNFNGSTKTGMVRLNTDLSIDDAFTGSGGQMGDIDIDGSDNVYIGRTAMAKHLRKLDPNGAELKVYVTNAITHLALQADGKLLAFASQQSAGVLALRLNTDFTLDNTFTTPHGPWRPGQIYGMDVLPDGDVVIVGDFLNFDGHMRGGIVRLNPDLTVDATLAGPGFNVAAGVMFDFVRAQPDGKFIVSGTFTTYDNAAASGIVRLNADGTLDPIFLATRPPSINDNALFEGYLYLSFQVAPSLRRLFVYGEVDNTFAPVITGGSVTSLAAHPTTAKVLIGGTFTSVNGTAVNKIASLNFDGTIDNTFAFTPGAGTNVGAVHLFGGDKFLLSGTFPMGSGSTNLAMLNANGTVTPGFTPPSTADFSLTSRPAPLKDKTILVKSSTHIDRLLSSGMRDPLFTKIPLSNFSLRKAVSMSSTHVLLYGTGQNNEYRFYHIELAPVPDPPFAPVLTAITTNEEGFPILNWTDNSSDEQLFLIHRATGNGEFEQLIGLSPGVTSFKDVSAVSNVQYRYRVGAKSTYGATFSNEVNFSGVITGVDESAEASVVYPNPGTGEFKFSFGIASDRSIIVSDITGQVIAKHHSVGAEFSLNLSAEPTGMFLVKIVEGALTRHVKLLKK